MWAAGQSGNPRGRPRLGQAVTPVIRRLLRAKDPATGRPNTELVARSLLDAALAGQIEAIKVLLDRVDGPLRVPLEHTGRDGAPIGLAFDHAAILAELVAPALALGPGDDRQSPGPPEGAGDGSSVGEDRDGG